MERSPGHMKVALYARVSTDTQEPVNQLQQLREWAARLEHQVVAEYVDVASGARRREHLDDLYDDAKKHHFDLVAVWSLDRLTREGPLACLLYIQRLTVLGVKFHSLQEAYLNPSLPFYDGIVALLADVARMERERIRGRIHAGLDRARRAGKHLGRPKGVKDAKRRRRRKAQEPTKTPGSVWRGF